MAPKTHIAADNRPASPLPKETPTVSFDVKPRYDLARKKAHIIAALRDALLKRHRRKREDAAKAVKRIRARQRLGPRPVIVS